MEKALGTESLRPYQPGVQSTMVQTWSMARAPRNQMLSRDESATQNQEGASTSG